MYHRNIPLCINPVFGLAVILFASLSTDPAARATELNAVETRQVIRNVLISADYQRAMSLRWRVDVQTEELSKEFEDGEQLETCGILVQEGGRFEQEGASGDGEFQLRKVEAVRVQPLTPPDLSILWLVLKGLGAMSAAILLFYLINEIPVFLQSIRRRRDVVISDEEVAEPIQEFVPVDKSKLDDADVVAADGDYAAAIRQLLLHSFDILDQNYGRLLSNSMTNREMLIRAPVIDAVKKELKSIVAAEELSHFGGTTPSERIYLDCRKNFHQFARIMNGEET